MAEKIKKIKYTNSSSGGLVYCLGFVGALIYFLQAADGFWMGVLGLLKALIWPAFIVYKLLESFYGLV